MGWESRAEQTQMDQCCSREVLGAGESVSAPSLQPRCCAHPRGTASHVPRCCRNPPGTPNGCSSHGHQPTAQKVPPAQGVPGRRDLLHLQLQQHPVKEGRWRPLHPAPGGTASPNLTITAAKQSSRSSSQPYVRVTL